MILDSGICTVFRKVNTASPGRMPVFSYEQIHKAWYGSLSFETSPRWATESREDVNVAMRIRILQNSAVNNHDIVVLQDTDEVADGMTVYEVIRAFHGTESESGALISDLSLEVTK